MIQTHYGVWRLIIVYGGFIAGWALQVMDILGAGVEKKGFAMAVVFVWPSSPRSLLISDSHFEVVQDACFRLLSPTRGTVRDCECAGQESREYIDAATVLKDNVLYSCSV